MNFVSRAGQKLEHALAHFNIDVAGKSAPTWAPTRAGLLTAF